MFAESDMERSQSNVRHSTPMSSFFRISSCEAENQNLNLTLEEATGDTSAVDDIFDTEPAAVDDDIDTGPAAVDDTAPFYGFFFIDSFPYCMFTARYHLILNPRHDIMYPAHDVMYPIHDIMYPMHDFMHS